MDKKLLERINEYDWESFKKAVYENAVNHGWHDKKRSFEEIICLIQCELSEAVEEYRNNRPMVWHDGEKPEGIAVELIDALIRLLDWAGDEEIDISNITIESLPDMETISLCTLVLALNLSISHTIDYAHKSKEGFGLCPLIEHFIKLIFAYVDEHGLDPFAIMIEKHEYNKTRPYRHGGKVI